MVFPVVMYAHESWTIKKAESESEVTQSCLTLCDPMDCSLPRSSVQGIFQADLGAGGRGVDAPALPGPFRLAVGVATSTLRAATQLAPALRRAPAFSESRQVSSRDELDGMAAVPSREL